jgi:hypothetical protein
MKLIIILSMVLIIFVNNSCRQTGTTSSIDLAVVDEKVDSTGTDSIFIIDYTGKRWDVTHAVNEYGFVADQFQFGLGPFAIRPILNPEMLSPGDAGYPASDESMRVIGTSLNGSVRAYPLHILISHEIADEKFGNIYVAVGY